MKWRRTVMWLLMLFLALAPAASAQKGPIEGSAPTSMQGLCCPCDVVIGDYIQTPGWSEPVVPTGFIPIVVDGEEYLIPVTERWSDDG